MIARLQELLATGYAYGKTLAISVPTVVEAQLGRLTRDNVDARLHSWSRNILAHAKIEVDVEDAHKVPRHPVVFMSNHESLVDIFVLFVACPGSLRMVAKAELFRVPIWGRAMRDAGFIPVDRSGDRERARRAMAAAADIVRSGISVWIAPQGRRCAGVGQLKRGGFLLAMETQTPIVPVALYGTAALLPRGSLLMRRGRVRVRFGDPIDVFGRSEAELMADEERFLTDA